MANGLLALEAKAKETPPRVFLCTPFLSFRCFVSNEHEKLHFSCRGNQGSRPKIKDFCDRPPYNELRANELTDTIQPNLRARAH